MDTQTELLSQTRNDNGRFGIEKTKEYRKKTPETLRRITNHVRAGRTLQDAAILSGITPSTLSVWQAADPKVKQAINEASSSHFKQIERYIIKAAKKSWQAGAWWLERRSPEIYALKPASLFSGTGGVTIQILSGGYQPPILKDKPVIEGELASEEKLEAPESHA